MIRRLLALPITVALGFVIAGCGGGGGSSSSGAARTGLIVFQKGEFQSQPAGISAINPDNTNARTVAASGLQPSLSGDGRKIAYLDPATNTVPDDVILADADGSNAVRLQLLTALSGLPGVIGGLRQPDLNRDASRITFTAAVTGAIPISLFVADLSSAGRVTAVRRLASGNGAADPVFSPDGRRIAFTRAGVGNTRTVFVINADGSSLQRLETPSTPAVLGRVSNPTWRPDGRKIVFAFEPGGGFSSLAEADVASGTVRDLNPALGGVESPAYSPDGTQIAFIRGTQLLIADATGMVPRALDAATPAFGPIDWN